MQGRMFTYKKSKYSKHTKEKTLHMEFYIQKYGKKKNLLQKILSFPIHKRDKTLNTSKKEVRNGGIGN
jgi:hypothetical protein